MNKKSQKDCKDCDSRHKGVFCALSDEAVQEFNKHKTTNTYKKGQVVFYEGNQPFGVYCIFAGRVKVYKSGIDGRQQIVRIAGPGDMIGYRSLFAEEPYQGTAEALEDTEICCIDKNAFFPTLSKNPKLSLAIIKKLSQELRSAEDLATSIAQKSVRERMAELLLMMKQSYGKKTKNGILIDLQLSREEIAEMIGVTQETAIRLLSEFKKDGYIEVKDRDITILNPQALIETAKIEI